MRLLPRLLLAVTPIAVFSQPKPPAPEPPAAERRTDLNLLNKTDTASGESRRNENVQFNLIDNNALKELNIRLGTTATLIEEANRLAAEIGAERASGAPEVSVS
jgi:hypothetical protein